MHALEPDPGVDTDFGPAYAQIELGALFEQIRAKPLGTLAGAMMSSANTPFI
jgi:hypothetical protein